MLPYPSLTPTSQYAEPEDADVEPALEFELELAPAAVQPLTRSATVVSAPAAIGRQRPRGTEAAVNRIIPEVKTVHPGAPLPLYGSFNTLSRYCWWGSISQEIPGPQPSFIRS